MDMDVGGLFGSFLLALGFFLISKGIGTVTFVALGISLILWVFLYFVYCLIFIR
jgi:hypothetical protein